MLTKRDVLELLEKELPKWSWELYPEATIPHIDGSYLGSRITIAFYQDNSNTVYLFPRLSKNDYLLDSYLKRDGLLHAAKLLIIACLRGDPFNEAKLELLRSLV